MYSSASCVEHLYAGGLWIGGTKEGVRFVTEGYNSDNGLGYLIPEQKDTARDKIWHYGLGQPGPGFAGIDDDGDGLVDEDELDGIDNDGDWDSVLDDVGTDGFPDSLETGCKGGYDPLRNPDPAYDNFSISRRDSCHPNPNGTFPAMSDRNRWTERNGKADHGETHVDEDYGAMSGRDVVAFATDTFRVPTIPRHHPLRIKVTLKSHAWDQPAGDGLIINEYFIINLDTSSLDSVCLAYMAECDVGPVDVIGYYNHNAAAFDPVSKTAFVYNPVDKGSSPIGFSWTASPIAAPRSVFRWWDFSTNPGPGTADDNLFAWMTGNGCTDTLCADPNQSAAGLSDTRFFTATGPYGSIAPGETLKVVTSLISGRSVADMIRNSARARRIVQSGYVLPPVVEAVDNADGSVGVRWQGGISPYETLDRYELFYGTDPNPAQSGIRMEVSGGYARVAGLPAGKKYFAVRSLGKAGPNGPVSDVAINAPTIHGNISVDGQERAIVIRWPGDTTAVGYNVYRKRTGELEFAKLNDSPLARPVYVDLAVTGARTYSYRVTAVSRTGVEGDPSLEDSSSLIPPKPPARVVVIPGKAYVGLKWDQGQEADLQGYNVYRSPGPGKLNAGLLRSPRYFDSTVTQGAAYTYCVEAVDSTGGSAQTCKTGKTGLFNPAVLAANMSLGSPDSLGPRLEAILAGVNHRIITGGSWLSRFQNLDTLSNYSTVLMLFDSITSMSIGNVPVVLEGFVRAGGKLLVAGRGLASQEYPGSVSMFRNAFGITSALQISNTHTFVGAEGRQGYPDVSLENPGAPLDLIEVFGSVPEERVLMTYKSNPYDPVFDGKPVGILSDAGNVAVITFPLNRISRASTAAIIGKTLHTFGFQQTALGTAERLQLPSELKISNAFPNPFNPSTTINLELPYEAKVVMAVYDITGREVSRIADGIFGRGAYAIPWSASGIASGVYFCRCTVKPLQPDAAGIRTAIQKLLLMK